MTESKTLYYNLSFKLQHNNVIKTKFPYNELIKTEF